MQQHTEGYVEAQTIHVRKGYVVLRKMQLHKQQKHKNVSSTIQNKKNPERGTDRYDPFGRHTKETAHIQAHFILIHCFTRRRRTRHIANDISQEATIRRHDHADRQGTHRTTNGLGRSPTAEKRHVYFK